MNPSLVLQTMGQQLAAAVYYTTSGQTYAAMPMVKFVLANLKSRSVVYMYVTYEQSNEHVNSLFFKRQTLKRLDNTIKANIKRVTFCNACSSISQTIQCNKLYFSYQEAWYTYTFSFSAARKQEGSCEQKAQTNRLT